MFLVSEGTKEEIPGKPKPEYDLQFEGKIEFKNDFHRHMHKFSEAHSFSVFMLLVIVANCGILIAMTFEVVVVRGGKTFSFMNGHRILSENFLPKNHQQIGDKIQEIHGKLFTAPTPCNRKNYPHGITCIAT